VILQEFIVLLVTRRCYEQTRSFARDIGVNMDKISDWTNGTIDRICDIMEGKGEQWLRMSTDYRKHTKERKY